MAASYLWRSLWPMWKALASLVVVNIVWLTAALAALALGGTDVQVGAMGGFAAGFTLAAMWRWMMQPAGVA